jgi:hypothetical protein
MKRLLLAVAASLLVAGVGAGPAVAASSGDHMPYDSPTAMTRNTSGMPSD